MLIAQSVISPTFLIARQDFQEMTGSINKENIDWSVYLVTDSDLLSPSAKSFEDHVVQAIEGGVGIVQLREKKLSTGDFIKKGKQLLKFTREKRIPLIINDRVDIALAVDADGVHVGQDDMGITPSASNNSES